MLCRFSERHMKISVILYVITFFTWHASAADNYYPVKGNNDHARYVSEKISQSNEIAGYLLKDIDDDFRMGHFTRYAIQVKGEFITTRSNLYPIEKQYRDLKTTIKDDFMNVFKTIDFNTPRPSVLVHPYYSLAIIFYGDVKGFMSQDAHREYLCTILYDHRLGEIIYQDRETYLLFSIYGHQELIDKFIPKEYLKY
jgi:hypothetical protein